MDRVLVICRHCPRRRGKLTRVEMRTTYSLCFRFELKEKTMISGSYLGHGSKSGSCGGIFRPLVFIN